MKDISGNEVSDFITLGMPDEMLDVSDYNREKLGNYQPFSHLHLHTDASNDGLGKTEDMVIAAKSKRFRHIAVTDHGTLANSIAFTKACERHDIKPIVGNEIYLLHNDETFHLTILADGNSGFKSLVELNNVGKSSGRRMSSVTLEELITHSDNLYVLSGCPKSLMQQANYSDAKNVALRLKGVFGERFFIEIMFNGYAPHSEAPFERSIRLAKDLNLPLVLTNDTHFAINDPKMVLVHNVLRELKNTYIYDSKDLYLATHDDIKERIETRFNSRSNTLLRVMKIAMSNAFWLSEKLESVKFDSKPQLPLIDDADNILRTKTYESMGEFLRTNSTYSPSVVSERVATELEVIINNGYATYFLIVEEIIAYALSQNATIGAGRGSAVGSMVAYLLGITRVNPLDYDLYFERFLNPYRIGMPDIDTDIASIDRPYILDYTAKKYGAIAIGTQSRFEERSLIRDLCRVFRVPRKDSDAAADGGFESDEYWLVANANASKPNMPPFHYAYKALIGQIRHLGKHAGGIIITDGSIPVPQERANDGTIMTAWTEGKHAELSAAGIVKLDFLGLTSLSILAELRRTTGAKAPEPYDNAVEYDLIENGDLFGIFQLSGSEGIKEYASRLAPKSIHDVIAAISLWRTGTIKAGAHEAFLKARNGKPRLIHPEIDKLLEGTFGLLVYQEDFMKLYAWATGKSLGEADIARRAIVKYKPGDLESEERLNTVEREFIQGAINHGLDTKTVADLWEEIKFHTGYSFNKSHAAAYAMITWEMLWYKYHHPAHFYTALLNAEDDDKKRQELIFEVVEADLDISYPDVNKSEHVTYVTRGSTIFFPIKAIKHLGENGAIEILRERPFATPEEFMTKVSKRKLPGRARAGLYMLGSFNSIGGSPEDYDITKLDLLNAVSPSKLKIGIKKLFGSKKYQSFSGWLDGSVDESDLGFISDLLEDNPDKILPLVTLISEQEGLGVEYTKKFAYSLATGNYEPMVSDLFAILKHNKASIESTYLGIFVPTKEQVKSIKEINAKHGRIAGIVLEYTKKISNWNSATFWSIKIVGANRNAWTRVEEMIKTVKPGMIIDARIKETTGRIDFWQVIK